MDISELGMRVDSRQVRTAHGDLDNFSQAGKRADQSAKGLTESGKKMGVSMRAAAAGIAAAAAAAVSMVAAMRGIAEFDRQMSKVQAVSRATASEMAGLRDIAMDLGTTTEFSAKQAAEGLEFLSRAGWSAQESIKAIPAVLDLATASAMGLGAAADTASNIMSAFALEASRASDVADVLAAASSRANTDVSQLGEAMSFVGPVASALEIEMSATAAAIGVLSDAGIQGSTAGTGLRRVLSSLANPTGAAAAALNSLGVELEAVNPQTNDLTDIVDELAMSGLSAADALTIFGDRGGPAILALVSQNDKLRELSGELTNVEGEAARMADTMRDNLGGDIDALWSAVQSLVLSLGDAGLTGAFRALVQAGTGFVRFLADVIGYMEHLGTVLAGLAATRIPAMIASLGTLNLTLNITAIRLGAALVSAQALTTAMRGLGAALAIAGGPWGIVIGLAAAAASHFWLFRNSADAVNESLIAAQQASSAQAQSVTDLTERVRISTLQTRDQAVAILEEAEARQLAVAAARAHRLEETMISDEYRDLAQEIDNVTKLVERHTEALDERGAAAAREAGHHRAMLEIYEEELSVLQAKHDAMLGMTEEEIRAREQISALLTDLRAKLEEGAFASQGVADGAYRARDGLNEAANAAVALRNALSLAEAGIQRLNEGISDTIMRVEAQTRAVREGVDTRIAMYQAERNAIVQNMAAQGASLDQIAAATTETTNLIDSLSAAIDENTQATDRYSTSAGGAASAAGSMADEMERLGEQWRSRTRTDLERYTAGLEELTALLEAGAIDGETYARGIEQLNDELAESLPLVNDLANAWADWVVSGFQDFKGFVDAVWSSFRNLLRDMIATAARNRIMISLGIGGGGIAGTAAAAATGGGGGGGGILGSLLGGVLGSFGGHGSILGFGGLGGGVGLLGGLGNALSGGLGGIFSVGTNALAAGGGLMATIGAAMPIIAGIALIASALIGSRKTVGEGVKGTLGGEQGALAEQFRDVQTSRLFGLLKSTRRHTDPAPEIESMLAGMALNLQERVEHMAEALDLGTKGLEDVLVDFDIDTRDMDEAAIQQALQEQLDLYGDRLAELVLGRPLDDILTDFDGDNPLTYLKESLEEDSEDTKKVIEGVAEGMAGVAQAAQEADEWTNKWAKEGEGALDTLTRLYNSMIAVNQVMDTLGHEFRAVGLEGADLASKLVDAFGGLEAMNEATSRFFDLMYTEEERRATITRQVREQLSEMNMVMPQTRAQLREMVEGLDLSTESGREAYATLISLAEAFDFILPSMQELSKLAMELHGVVASDLDAMIAAVTQETREAANTARMWQQAARGLREFIDRLEGTAGALISPQAALSNTQARFESLMQSALGGDVQAARDIPRAAGRLLDAAGAMAGDATELARVEAQVLRGTRMLTGAADVEQMRHEAIAHILESQLEVLTETRDFMREGGVLNEEMIDNLNAELSALEGAMKAAEMINYQFLKERLDVAVDLLVDADIPEDVRQIIANTAAGIERDIDVIFNTAWLAPEERWLALTAASEHIRTVEMIVEGTERWGKGLRLLAMETVGNHRRTIDFILGADLDPETRRIALAGSSELARIVNVDLDEKYSDWRALRVALQDSSRHAVHIRGHLARENPEGMKRMLESIDGVSEGKLNLGGNFEFDPSKAFSTWFEGALSDKFETPMDRLRGPLDALRESMDELRTQLWIDRLTPDTIVDRFPEFDPDIVRGDLEGVHRAWTGQIARLGHLLGVDMRDASGNIRGFDATRRDVARTARDLGIIGPNEMIWHAGGGLSDSEWRDWLRDNMPGFASGGSHSGGLRIVGEHGPELEATGPSRIYSASQTRSMLDSGDVVSELRALRREVATLRDQSRQLDTQVVRNTKRTRDILQEWNAVGMPAEATE